MDTVVTVAQISVAAVQLSIAAALVGVSRILSLEG
jgi:hypothetical protein